MSGAPLPIPKLPCAVCVGKYARGPSSSPEPATATTLAGGWLVCTDHAGLMVLDLAATRYQLGTGTDPIHYDGTERDISELL